LGWLFETKFRDLNRAEDYYSRALEMAPNYPAIYSNYSVLLSTVGKYDKLEMVLNQGLSVPGVDKANMFNEFGIMHEQKGNYEQAIHFYKECGKATLAKDTLDRAVASIERCKTKQTLL
jgi:tetratricopeptide (TPR) repeat protein